MTQVRSARRSTRSSSSASPLITASSPNFLRSRSIACSASAVRRSSRSARSAPSAASRPETPMPIRRNCVPSVSRASSSRPAAKILAASWVGWLSDCARVRMRKSAVLSFERHGRAGKLVRLEAGRDLLGQPPQPQLERPEVGDVAGRTWSRPRRSWLSRSARTGRSSRPCASAAEPRAFARRSGASARPRPRAADRRWCAARRARAAPAPPCRRRRSASTGLRRQECRRLGAAKHRKAARLVEVGGDLGEELVAGEPDRHRDADALARPRSAKPASDLRGRACRAAARCRTGP